MILSHSRQFVFIATRKVASSSLELALSELLNERDFTSKLKERDQGDGTWEHSTQKYYKTARFGLPYPLNQHSPIWKVYRVFGREVKDYLVVSAERNPWDRAVSSFFWTERVRGWKSAPLDVQRKEFKRFTFRYSEDTIAAKFSGRRRNRKLSMRNEYSIDGVSMVDHMIRFECLADDVRALGEALNLEKPLSLKGKEAKMTTRPKKTSCFQDLFDEETREFVADVCRWEIDTYGYDFEGQVKPCFTPDPDREEVKEGYLRRLRL